MRTIGWQLAAVALLLGVHALPAAAQDGTPLFRFYAFSTEDLEILPGQNMNLHGPIHANGDLYLNCENSLTIGDSTAVPLARVTAGGHVYRGRKNTTNCSGTVQIDALRDVLPPAGDLDPVTLSCGPGLNRVMVSPEQIAAFDGSVADESPYGRLPSLDLIGRGYGEYWHMADLHLALDLSSPDSNGLYPIQVLTSSDTVDTTLTPRLHTFMTAKPGRIFYNDVPKANSRNAGSCSPPSSTTTYCHPSAYVRAFSTSNSGPGGAEQPDVYPCVQTDLNLYPSCTGTCSASSPPSCGTYMRTLNQGFTGRTSRRGGFYDNREGKWVYMLNVNIHDLLVWNRAQSSSNRLFDPDDASEGGLIIFLTVRGPNSETPGTNSRYGVRVFGSPNLDFPTGAADPTGVTVVSDQSIYVEGHYNVDSTAGGIYDSARPWMPAALMGDAINVLSSNWSGHNNGTGFTSTRCRNDCQSRKSLDGPSERPAATTYVNAAFLGGASQTSGSNYGGGLESYPRLHESWSATTLRYRGSFVTLGPPLRNPGAWCGTGGSSASGCNIYNPPTRDWDFDPRFLEDAMLPPGTLFLGCGNGVVDDGESCDDGNTASGDCCSSLCQIEPAGSVCRGTASACDAADVCDGMSPVCPTDAPLDDGAACEDGDPCTTGDVCAAGTCTPGAGCDDGDVCTDDVCTPTGCTFDATPATTCHAAATSTFTLSQKNGVSRSLRWKWMRGTSMLAEYGVPNVSTGYTLCVYDAAGTVLQGTVPAGSARWRKAGANVWRYTDPTASAAGISKLDLAGSDVDRARIALTAVGDALPDPDLSAGLALPVTVQLRRDDAPACWSQTFGPASVKRNDASRFDVRAR